MWPWPLVPRLPLAATPVGWAAWSSPARLFGGATKEITDVQPVGGFLPNPSLLNPGGSGQAALVYRNPTANFASYDKMMLDPVMIWAPPDSQLNTVPPAQRQAVADTFYSDLHNALKKRCQMVASPATWLDVDHAFQAWSEQLASRMQELGACQQ
jgi:hypothetical protein